MDLTLTDEQQAFQALFIFGRKLNIAQHQVLHHDPIGELRDHASRGGLAHFFALGRKKLAHQISGSEIP